MSTKHTILTYTEAADALRIGRTKLFAFVGANQIKSISIGGKRFVHRDEIERIQREGLPPANASARGRPRKRAA